MTQTLHKPVPILTGRHEHDGVGRVVEGSASRIFVAITPLLLSREQAAIALGGISVSHLDRLERAGKIGPSPVKLGRCIVYSVDELRRWCEAGCPSRVEWDR